ncbi:APC family permease [Pseudonocardia oceani]|uniref:APC family permease n=1 Tax=Pseudonocardia oceani TaxID=2792013 RepID=UPI001CF68A11|nr:APC family permease [Pseudonocardia oceani]
MPLPKLRHRSPVHGLDRRNLGPAEVLAQSVAGAAPAAAMATVPAIVAATAGPGTLWAFVVATVVALLIGSCIGQFTRRMAAAGSLYSLTAQGLGPAAAFSSGVALLVGYGVLAMAALTGSAIYLDALVTRLGGSSDASRPVLVLSVCVLAALATAGVLVRVRLSARLVLLVEAVSITLMTVVFLALLGADAPAGPPPPDPGPGGIAAAVLPALGAFIGFEAATAMGVEARRPFRTIPRVVSFTAAATGVLYLFAAYTQISGFAAGGLTTAPQPVLTLAMARGQAWIAVVLDLGIAMSFAACTLATLGALVRVVFSMARDGIVPAALGGTHPRFRTPHVAIAAVLPVVAAVPAGLLAAGVPGPRVLAELLTVATAGYLVAYLLVCLAAPPFLRRIGELTTWPVVVTAVAAPVLLAVLGAFVVSQWGGAVPLVIALLGLAGAVWLGWLRWRRPAALAGIGAYDETVADDVLVAP